MYGLDGFERQSQQCEVQLEQLCWMQWKTLHYVGLVTMILLEVSPYHGVQRHRVENQNKLIFSRTCLYAYTYACSDLRSQSNKPDDDLYCRKQLARRLVLHLHVRARRVFMYMYMYVHAQYM